MKELFTEEEVVRVWQSRLLERTRLVTESGEPMEVVYPGRRNDGRGADFRDAVIATGGRLKTGDVELHVRSSDWWGHGHDRDAAYNRVILHVVVWDDTRQSIISPNGIRVPVLALGRFAESFSPTLIRQAAESNIPCLRVTQHTGEAGLGGILDEAGEKRFFEKAARFQSAIEEAGAAQSLYEGLMVALGYSQNKQPFLELARRLPLGLLDIAPQGGTGEEYLACRQAVLLGTAGLLPSQRGCPASDCTENWVETLERSWASRPRVQVMSLRDWRLFKVRPNNSPLRRLAALSYLMLRFSNTGMLEGAMDRVKELPVEQCASLKEIFLVADDGYWADHSDFGQDSRQVRSALLGDGRAGEIVVNILLPFSFAWSRNTARPELAKKTLDIYRNYPRTASNSIERHMVEQLGINHRLINTARRQQGLIHIYDRWCIQGRCHDCWLVSCLVG